MAHAKKKVSVNVNHNTNLKSRYRTDVETARVYTSVSWASDQHAVKHCDCSMRCLCDLSTTFLSVSLNSTA